MRSLHKRKTMLRHSGHPRFPFTGLRSFGVRSSLWILYLSFLMISQASAVPRDALLDRIISKDRLIRHRLGFILNSDPLLSYALEIEDRLLTQLSFGHYRLLESGYTDVILKGGWPGLAYTQFSDKDYLYRQVYSLSLGLGYHKQFERPNRQKAELQELRIPISVDFDLSYVFNRSGLNFYGSLGIWVSATHWLTLNERSEIAAPKRVSPLLELGLGYSF